MLSEASDNQNSSIANTVDLSLLATIPIESILSCFHPDVAGQVTQYIPSHPTVRDRRKKSLAKLLSRQPPARNEPKLITVSTIFKDGSTQTQRDGAIMGIINGMEGKQVNSTLTSESMFPMLVANLKLSRSQDESTVTMAEGVDPQVAAELTKLSEYHEQKAIQEYGRGDEQSRKNALAYLASSVIASQAAGHSACGSELARDLAARGICGKDWYVPEDQSKLGKWFSDMLRSPTAERLAEIYRDLEVTMTLAQQAIDVAVSPETRGAAFADSDAWKNFKGSRDKLGGKIHKAGGDSLFERVFNLRPPFDDLKSDPRRLLLSETSPETFQSHARHLNAFAGKGALLVDAA